MAENEFTSLPYSSGPYKVKVGSVDSDLESSIGVRQGSCEGPVLFLFIMQAAMETMNWPVPKPEFRTRTDDVIMGEKSERKRGAAAFEFWLSLFADDCALFFNTRSVLITGKAVKQIFLQTPNLAAVKKDT